MAWTEVLMSGNPENIRETEEQGSRGNEETTAARDEGNGNDPGCEEPDSQKGEFQLPEAVAGIEAASEVNAVSTGVSDYYHLWCIIVIGTVAGIMAVGVYLLKRKRKNDT